MNVTRKVRYGTAVTVGTGLVTWLLVTYVFHGSLPPDLATALPVIVASVLGAVTAWWTKHAPQDLRVGVRNLIHDAEALADTVQNIHTTSLPNSLPVADQIPIPLNPGQHVSARPPAGPRAAVGTTPWAAEPAMQAWAPAHPVVDIVQPPLKMYEPTTTLTGTALTHPADGTTSPPVSNPAAPAITDKDHPEPYRTLEVTDFPEIVVQSPDGPPKVNQQAALGLDPYGVK